MSETVSNLADKFDRAVQRVTPLAYRLRRRGDTTSDLSALRQDLQHRRILTTHTIYECPSCGERFVGERRCSSCQLFCRSVGLGGHCSECESPIVFAEVLDNDA